MANYGQFYKKSKDLQDGPLLVINGAITPIIVVLRKAGDAPGHKPVLWFCTCICNYLYFLLLLLLSVVVVVLLVVVVVLLLLSSALLLLWWVLPLAHARPKSVSCEGF